MEKTPFPEDYPLQSPETSKITGSILRSWAEKLERGELRIIRGTTSFETDAVEIENGPRFVNGVRCSPTSIW
jgi:hypothetical protein